MRMSRLVLLGWLASVAFACAPRSIVSDGGVDGAGDVAADRASDASSDTPAVDVPRNDGSDVPVMDGPAMDVSVMDVPAMDVADDTTSTDTVDVPGLVHRRAHDVRCDVRRSRERPDALRKLRERVRIRRGLQLGDVRRDVFDGTHFV